MLLRGNSLIVLLLLISFFTSAQIPKEKKWYSPEGLTIMYAGGFGMLSAGPVFYHGNKLESSLTFGYTPAAYGNIATINLLSGFKGFEIGKNKKISAQLLKAGVFVNFNIGNNIPLKWPDVYPEKYYWWNSSMRFGPYIDTGLKYSPAMHKFNYNIFFHCNTNDLYLASYILNPKTLSIYDILVFGIGIKITTQR